MVMFWFWCLDRMIGAWCLDRMMRTGEETFFFVNFKKMDIFYGESGVGIEKLNHDGGYVKRKTHEDCYRLVFLFSKS